MRACDKINFILVKHYAILHQPPEQPDMSEGAKGNQRSSIGHTNIDECLSVSTMIMITYSKYVEYLGNALHNNNPLAVISNMCNGAIILLLTFGQNYGCSIR